MMHPIFDIKALVFANHFNDANNKADLLVIKIKFQKKFYENVYIYTIGKINIGASKLHKTFLRQAIPCKDTANIFFYAI